MLTLNLPQYSYGLIDKPLYNINGLGPARGRVNVAPAGSPQDYTMHLDTDADGVFDDGTIVPINNPQTGVDFVPPGQVNNLSLVSTGNGKATVEWTAPGDDGSYGQAAEYDLRYSTSAIVDEYGWAAARPASGEPQPAPAGTQQSFTVDNLDGGTCYFAIKVHDDVGLESSLSNTISAVIPVLSSIPSVPTSQVNGQTILISMPYAGDENSDGAVRIEYKSSEEAAWQVYGTSMHPQTEVNINLPCVSCDIKLTYLDPDGIKGSDTKTFFGIEVPDLSPPLLTNVQPAGTVFGSTQTITAEINDQEPSSGIDPWSTSVFLDGNLVDSCNISETNLSCPINNLAYGPHSITGSVYDNSGNETQISSSFMIGDNTPPVVTNVQPVGTVYGGATTITAEFNDPGISGGINVGTVSVSLDGNMLQGCAVTDTGVYCDANGILYGTHTISGSVVDNDGNSSPIMGSFNMIEWSTPSIMYQSPAAISQPSLYRLSDGRTMLAYTDNLSINAINFRVSNDNGLTWQIPTGSSGHVPCAAGVQPSITQLPSGVVAIAYAEYYRNPLNGAYSWVLRVTQSSDLINWSWPSFAGSGNTLAPSIKTLSNGQVLLAHTKYVGASADIYATRGTFNGNYWIWSTDATVYGGAQYDSKPAIADAGNGDLLIAFFSGSNWSADRNTWLSRDINLVRSTNGGLTWSQTPTAVYTNTGSADFWPSMVRLNNGQVLCAFTTSDQGSVNQLNIKMVSSGDGGATWGNEQMISIENHSESSPALIQQAYGSLLAVWDSDPGQANEMYYLYSSRLVIP